MKLSEIKGEKAIEVFADLLEPVGAILSDNEIAELIRKDSPKLEIIQRMLKKHAKEVVQMMAVIDDVPVEEYEVNFVTLPAKLIELFNDEALTQVFRSQSQDEV